MDYLFTLFVGVALGTGAGWYLKGRFGAQVAAVKNDLKA